MATKFRGIRKAAEYRRGELIKDLLRLVAAGVVVGAASIAAPNTVQLLEYFDPKGRAQRNKIWNVIRYLEKRRDIEISIGDDGKEYLYLTQRGKIRFDSDSVWELTINPPRRWDRKWRLVMFDFPTRTRQRHEFRAKLEDFGFHMYQRSVFIYPHECREEVFAVAKWMHVHEHVRYVVATEIHDMRRFVKLFDLL